MKNKKSNGVKISIKFTQRQTLIFGSLSLGSLVLYYLWRFGFEAIEIDLLKDYWLLQGNKRFTNKNPIWIMMNSFMLPDKSSTLLAMLGVLLQLILAWFRNVNPNAFTRILWLLSILLLLPLGFTLFFDSCLFIAFLLPVLVVFLLFRWILRGKLT